VLVTLGLAVGAIALGVAAGLSRAGLVRLWAMLALVTLGLAVGAVATGVAAGFAGAGLVRLRTVGVPPAESLSILQPGLNLLANPLQQPERLVQGLLGWLDGAGLGLHHLSFLSLDPLLELGQGARHGIAGHPGGQAESQVEVLLQPQNRGLVGHLA
jgi:hypothetical protein